MPRAFETWTVLPHQPIEKLTDNLWRVNGRLPKGETQRQMVLARMGDGRVVVHNAIALDAAEMAELEAWGTPSSGTRRTVSSCGACSVIASTATTCSTFFFAPPGATTCARG